MPRYLKQHILEDLPTKIILLTGPRQSGKTMLSKALYDDFDYLNYDSTEDRQLLLKKYWNRNKSLIIFDELHKKRHWKQWVKGVYDTEGIPPQLLVTGSACLDTYRKVGDSLAGRYFQFHLHPLDLWEIKHYFNIDRIDTFDTLWRCGGFPEPFLNGTENFYRRWRNSHLDIILRQDLVDLYSIRDIKSIETLVELLKERVGSPVSYASLGRNLERDVNTIKRWLQMLENLYVIFRVTPYHKNIARSLLKEPKFYFYDHACIKSSDGAHFENIVASALLKHLHRIQDLAGIRIGLYYLRTKEGKELDFLITFDGVPSHVIEVKLSDDDPSKHFGYFSKFLNLHGEVKLIQLVKNLMREKTTNTGIEIRDAVSWLTEDVAKLVAF